MDLKSKAMLSVAETVRNMYNPKPVEPIKEASMMKDTGEVVHNCAKHVEHAEWGRGVTMAEQHDAPDDAGNIGWYDVLFDHGLERAVPTVNLNILVSESHGHPMKKKKMTEGKVNEENLDEFKNRITSAQSSHNVISPNSYSDGANSGKLDSPKEYHKKMIGYHTDLKNHFVREVDKNDQRKKIDLHKQALHAHETNDENKHKLTHLATSHSNKEGKFQTKEMPNFHHRFRRSIGIKEEIENLDELKASTLHPNQQKLDVHEPEKDELTADDFKKLRAGKKAKVKEDTEVKEALSGDNSRNTENDRTKETAMQAAKAAAAKTMGTAAVPGQVHGAKVGGERELIKQGVTKEDVDETIIYHNADLFLEAIMSADVKDRMKSHEKAGHKVSDQAGRMKDGQMEYSFVVTQPSGKRSRHIYHGSKVKHETMSPAPKSKEASEIGDDEDDK